METYAVFGFILIGMGLERMIIWIKDYYVELKKQSNMETQKFVMYDLKSER